MLGIGMSVSGDGLKATPFVQKNMRAVARQCMGVASYNIGSIAKTNVMSGETIPWFQRRAIGIIKGYFRLAAMRMSGYGDTIRGVSKAKATRNTAIAATVEVGGEYTQYVKDYTRTVTEVWGKRVKPFAQHVNPYGKANAGKAGGYKRIHRIPNAKERPAHYLQRACDTIGDKATRPFARGFEVMWNEQRVPSFNELISAAR